ncbi:MAG: hypothetical protein HY062_17880 [Bacteroidetes bacterium]|nr:hypothetical protein [Bacteroidota bacterium]
MKQKYLLIATIGLLIVICFTTCKKYPENNLWFKSPARVIEGKWKLCFFEINHNDSLNSNVNLLLDKEISFKLNYSNKILYKHHRGSIEVINGDSFEGSWNLTENKKNIEISFSNDKYEYYANDTNCVCYNFNNIFIKYHTKISWKIEKLNTKEFWISTDYNNNYYELHFKK